MGDTFSGQGKYAKAGVDTEAISSGLNNLLSWVSKTHNLRSEMGEYVAGANFFASVVKISNQFSLAISTDGVGSKSMVAQIAGKYESIGYDCVAVNVNDVICVGAEPVALVDYISVEAPKSDLLSEIGKGLYEGSIAAGISIVGGELSVHPDSLQGPNPGYAFDISGTAVGILENRVPILGQDLVPGDVIIGIPSNGIHANGLTLARDILLKDYESSSPNVYGSLIQELLKPTRIYVPEVMALLNNEIEVHGLAHISGDGLLNLSRLNADVDYIIDSLIPTPLIFDQIKNQGKIGVDEMFQVFNMGVGFCVIVASAHASEALAILNKTSEGVQRIGTVVRGNRQIEIKAHSLVSRNGQFTYQ